VDFLVEYIDLRSNSIQEVQEFKQCRQRIVNIVFGNISVKKRAGFVDSAVARSFTCISIPWWRRDCLLRSLIFLFWQKKRKNKTKWHVGWDLKTTWQRRCVLAFCYALINSSYVVDLNKTQNIREFLVWAKRVDKYLPLKIKVNTRLVWSGCRSEQVCFVVDATTTCYSYSVKM